MQKNLKTINLYLFAKYVREGHPKIDIQFYKKIDTNILNEQNEKSKSKCITQYTNKKSTNNTNFLDATNSSNKGIR